MQAHCRTSYVRTTHFQWVKDFQFSHYFHIGLAVRELIGRDCVTVSVQTCIAITTDLRQVKFWTLQVNGCHPYLTPSMATPLHKCCNNNDNQHTQKIITTMNANNEQ